MATQKQIDVVDTIIDEYGITVENERLRAYVMGGEWWATWKSTLRNNKGAEMTIIHDTIEARPPTAFQILWMTLSEYNEFEYPAWVADVEDEQGKDAAAQMRTLLDQHGEGLRRLFGNKAQTIAFAVQLEA